VLVIDNGSTDDSTDVARAAGARVIEAPGERVARLRNIGAHAASGRVLAFVDADHVLDPGWISVALENFALEPSIGAAGALCRAPQDGTWVQRAYDRLRKRRRGRAEVEWLGAGNMAVARDAFQTVGGFDERLETCEDVDLCKRLRSAGYRLIADDRMGNVHLGDPETLRDLFRGELWRGRSNLAVSFRPPFTLRDLPSAAVPVVQLGGLVAAPLALAIGGPVAAAAGLVALAPIAIIPALRAARMSNAMDAFTVRELADNAAVAFVYDLARAFALVAFAGHRVRRAESR
jgi:hypothetical protein